MYGLSDSFIHFAAAAILLSFAGSFSSIVTAGAGVNSHIAICTSFGISTRTGPGLPDIARENASRIVSASSSTFPTK